VIIGADNLEANYRVNKLYIKEGKERSQTMLITIECYTFKPLKIKICKLRGLNVQHSMLITLPNLHIASLLAIQNKK
jgi:hypothetical protein